MLRDILISKSVEDLQSEEELFKLVQTYSSIFRNDTDLLSFASLMNTELFSSDEQKRESLFEFPIPNSLYNYGDEIIGAFWKDNSKVPDSVRNFYKVVMSANLYADPNKRLHNPYENDAEAYEKLAKAYRCSLLESVNLYISNVFNLKQSSDERINSLTDFVKVITMLGIKRDDAVTNSRPGYNVFENVVNVIYTCLKGLIKDNPAEFAKIIDDFANNLADFGNIRLEPQKNGAMKLEKSLTEDLELAIKRKIIKIMGELNKDKEWVEQIWQWFSEANPGINLQLDKLYNFKTNTTPECYQQAKEALRLSVGIFLDEDKLILLKSCPSLCDRIETQMLFIILFLKAHDEFDSELGDSLKTYQFSNTNFGEISSKILDDNKLSHEEFQTLKYETFQDYQAGNRWFLTKLIEPKQSFQSDFYKCGEDTKNNEKTGKNTHLSVLRN